MDEESFYQLDRRIIMKMQKWGTPLLRVSLGIVFFWFGALKLAGVSPLKDLLVTAYWFLPQYGFSMFLGIAECVIGLGLIFKTNLRLVLLVLWVQMAGTFFAMVLAPSLFFNGNPFALTLEGEFVFKNLVLVFASIVIGGFEVKPLTVSPVAQIEQEQIVESYETLEPKL